MMELKTSCSPMIFNGSNFCGDWKDNHPVTFRLVDGELKPDHFTDSEHSNNSVSGCYSSKQNSTVAAALQNNNRQHQTGTAVLQAMNVSLKYSELEKTGAALKPLDVSVKYSDLVKDQSWTSERLSPTLVATETGADDADSLDQYLTQSDAVRDVLIELKRNRQLFMEMLKKGDTSGQNNTVSEEIKELQKIYVEVDAIQTSLLRLYLAEIEECKPLEEFIFAAKPKSPPPMHLAETSAMTNGGWGGDGGWRGGVQESAGESVHKCTMSRSPDAEPAGRRRSLLEDKEFQLLEIRAHYEAEKESFQTQLLALQKNFITVYQRCQEKLSLSHWQNIDIRRSPVDINKRNQCNINTLTSSSLSLDDHLPDVLRDLVITGPPSEGHSPVKAENIDDAAVNLTELVQKLSEAEAKKKQLLIERGLLAPSTERSPVSEQSSPTNAVRFRTDRAELTKHSTDNSGLDSRSKTGTPKPGGQISRSNQTRPLTRYLPIVSGERDLDLAQFIDTAGHDTQGAAAANEIIVTSSTARGPITKQGGRIKTWRRRWLVFDRVSRTLAYYAREEDAERVKEAKGLIPFSDIKDVFVDHEGRATKSPNPRQTFCVVTSGRTYYIVAPSPESQRIWVDVIFTGAEAYRGYND